MIEEFIDKIIRESEEHLKKGNQTLGTLPSDWAIELEGMLKSAFIAHSKLLTFEEFIEYSNSCNRTKTCEMFGKYCGHCKVKTQN